MGYPVPLVCYGSWLQAMRPLAPQLQCSCPHWRTQHPPGEVVTSYPPPQQVAPPFRIGAAIS